MTLRKDLKPGTVFKYVHNTSQDLWYVSPYDQNCPLDEGKLVVSAYPSLAHEVEIVWEPSKQPQEPAHYVALTPEPIDVIESWGLNFRLANVIKYVARHGRKPGADAAEDLGKALRYLKREINAINGRSSWE